MLKILQSFFENKGKKASLYAFSQEAKANLEAYYVMFQINRLRFFTLASWEPVKEQVWPDAVAEYIHRLTQYNSLLKEYKDFEFWYNENLDRKNQENGRHLHMKKEIVQQHFKGLEDVIKNAIAAIEYPC